MLAALARPSVNASVSWHPLDDRWYSAIGGQRSDSGVTVVPESALGIAAVYRATNVLAHSVASVPLVVYQRTSDEGKEKARDHQAYDLLHDKPNTFMTSFRWRHLLMTQAVLWGNHYSEILPGMRGISGLVPLSPETTRIVDQLRDGRLLYVTRDKEKGGFGPDRKILQDDLLHVRGFSIDGKSGIPLTKSARNAMGLALTAERHGSMFLKKGARHAGFLTSPSAMQKEVREANEKAWQSQYGGSDATGATPLLTGGLEFKPVTANNRDSQWLEARTFQVEELLRFLGVPGVLCGYADKTATYASAEQFFLSFVTHTVRPWTENIAQELNASVITDSPRYFADFILEGLLRGDIKTRYTAHQIAINAGFKTPNEARIEENYNKGPAELDEFMRPMNMAVAGEEPEDEPAPRRAPLPAEEPEPQDDGARARLALLTERAAERIVRKEVAAVWGTNGKLGAAKRFASDAAAWDRWLVSFYDDLASDVAASLGLPDEVAAQYCADQRSRLMNGIPQDFEATSVAALLAVAGSAPVPVPSGPSVTVNVTNPVNITNAPPAVNVTTPQVAVTTPPVTVNTKVEAPKRGVRTMTMHDADGKVIRRITDAEE